MTAPFNPADPSTYQTANPVVTLQNQPIASGTLIPTPGNPPPTNNVVQTAGQATSQYNNLSGNLTNLLGQLNQPTNNEEPRLNVGNYHDAYTQALDAQAQRGSAATKALVASIQAQNQNMRNSLNTQYGDYKKGLQLLGIQQNSAQSSPDLLMGHIQQAQNEYTSKIQQLNSEESRAMLEAENARADKDLGTLKEKMNYIKEIQKEKDDALSRTYERMQLQTKIAENQASMYYDALQKLPDDQKEDFLIAVSKKYNIPLQSLVSALSDEATSHKKSKSGGSSASGGYTAQEKRKLRQAGIDVTDIASADDFLYGDSEGQDFYSLADQFSADEENLDEKGFLTAEAFKNLVKQGQSDKISRTNVIERYKDKLYLDKYKFAKNYGLTKSEFDKLTS